MANLEVLSFRRGPFWNFSYLIACPRTRQAAIIDPAWDAEAVLSAAGARGLDIRAILLTHAHTDHVNATATIAEATGARPFIHTAERAALETHFSGTTVEFGSEERLQLGDFELTLLPSPGHSPGSTSILVEGHIFSGDTLHVGGVGRPGPEPEALEHLWQSVRGAASLHPETILHPGHDEGPTPTSTIGTETTRTPALRAATYTEFVAAMERATGRRLT